MEPIAPIDEAVMMLVFSEGKRDLLLIKRDDVKLYAFAGGAIDNTDSSPEEAATREFFEETGFQTRILRKITRYSPFGPFSRTTHFFEGEIIGGIAKTSKETREVAFFPLDKLPKNLVPLYHDMIQDALDPNCPNEKPMPRMYWIRDWKFVYNPLIFVPFLWGRVKWWFKTKIYG
ncbi:MAG: NUDIX hydrolase [Chlamydiia bacterium]